jgi:hypothetical protein
MADAPAVTGGKRSAWMSHVKKTMKANKGKSLMQVLKMAKKTYKKTAKRGGGVASTAASVGGRRRRGGVDDSESDKDSDVDMGSEETSMGGRRRTRKSKRSRKH